MDWHDSKSSMKFSFRFVDEKMVDGVSFGKLEVRWQNGTLGAYLDVNRRTYEDFLATESRGKFLNSVIKPGFKYARIEEEKAEDVPAES